jgi:hypothetical protein
MLVEAGVAGWFVLASALAHRLNSSSVPAS